MVDADVFPETPILSVVIAAVLSLCIGCGDYLAPVREIANATGADAAAANFAGNQICNVPPARNAGGKMRGKLLR